MDAYEATRVVFARIQSLDPENAAKIMGLLLIQDHGEKEMIRLAFGPESLVHSVVLKARKDLGLLAPSNPTTPSAAAAPPSPFNLARQNSSRLLGGLPPALTITSPSWAQPQSFSRSNSMNGPGPVDDLQNPDELISPSNYGGGDLIDEFQLQDQLSFLNDPTAAQIATKGGDFFYPDMGRECRSPSGNGEGVLFPYTMGWGANGHHRRSCSVADLCLSSDAAASGFGWKPCLYFARGYCKNGTSCRFLHGLPEDSAGSGKIDAVVEQQCQELLLRSKSQRLMASAFPFSPTGSVPPSPASTKCMNFLLQQQNDSQR